MRFKTYIFIAHIKNGRNNILHRYMFNPIIYFIFPVRKTDKDGDERSSENEFSNGDMNSCVD